jgi:cold shock CspA family protein
MENDNVNTEMVEVSGTSTDTVVEHTEELVVNEQVEDCVVVEEENGTKKVGKYVGQCKWFNDLLGYGFVTVCDGEDKGKDIFVHHSGIMPLNSNYRTLKKGEYLNFDIINGLNGLQAVHVTGIQGGPLMCDFVTSVKPNNVEPTSTSKPQSQQRTRQLPVQTQGFNQASNNNTQNKGKNGPGVQLNAQWYVVTKSGRKKNLAKYSKEGRTLMKQAKQQEA